MIERAAAADAPAIAELEERCLGPDAWSPALVEQGVAGTLPTVTYLVAREEGVVGYAVVSVAGDIAELQRIAVGAEHRRRGLATALLAAAVEAGRVGGADRLLLEVRPDNAAALAFYAAAGFVEIDRRPRYYADGGPAVVLRLPLLKGCG